MDYVIGVDIGTQSTKALLVAADGSIRTQATRSYAPETPFPSWAEQWPDVWLGAVEQCLSEIAQKGGAPASQIKAICISSLYGGSGIPVDEKLEPLHPCLIWMDRRAEAQVDWVKANVDLEQLQAVTGNGVDSYYGFTKMLWLRDARPELWSKTRYLMPPNSYVIQRLTGEIAVDHSSAGNIGGVYDMRERRWSREMLATLGIPARMMPERLVASTDVVGGLTPASAARLGLAAGTAVVAGGVDAAVATYAAGVVGPGQHVAMMGTSMCWGFIAPSAEVPRGLIAMPYVVRSSNYLYVFGGAATSGASVTWFLEQFCHAEIEAGAASGRDPHAILEEGAARIAAGADGVVFLPYLMGERSPIWDGKASGAFIGLNLFHTRAHLYRAVLEGVTFALRHNIAASAVSSVPLDPRLIVVGGAARSDLWMQIIADVTGFPVFTIREDVEAALGAARLAAIGIGLVEASASADWVTLIERALPDPSRKLRYDKMFEVYAGLYPVLSRSMHQLADLR